MKESAPGLVAVDRTVRVLKAVDSVEMPHLAEVARRAGLNEATTLRYLSTLTGLGFVDRVDGRLYRLGWEIYRLGQRALLDHVPRDAIRPVMEELLAAYNETVNFAWWKGDEVVVIDVVEGHRAVRKVSDVGQVDPWHASALAKALMSTMEERDWRALVGPGPLERFTEHTLLSPDLLAPEIEQARQDGYAVDHEEADEDLTCIAAAVPGSTTGSPRYAISVSFLTHRLDDEVIGHVGARVRAAAQTIGERLY